MIHYESVLLRREAYIGMGDVKLFDKILDPLKGLKSGAKQYMPDLQTLKLPQLNLKHYLPSRSPMARLRSWWKGGSRSVNTEAPAASTPVSSPGLTPEQIRSIEANLKAKEAREAVALSEEKARTTPAPRLGPAPPYVPLKRNTSPRMSAKEKFNARKDKEQAINRKQAQNGEFSSRQAASSTKLSDSILTPQQLQWIKDREAILLSEEKARTTPPPKNDPVPPFVPRYKPNTAPRMTPKEKFVAGRRSADRVKQRQGRNVAASTASKPEAPQATRIKKSDNSVLTPEQFRAARKYSEEKARTVPPPRNGPAPIYVPRYTPNATVPRLSLQQGKLWVGRTSADVVLKQLQSQAASSTRLRMPAAAQSQMSRSSSTASAA